MGLQPAGSLKMNSTPNKNAEQQFYGAPLNGYFTNFINKKIYRKLYQNTNFTRSNSKR